MSKHLLFISTGLLLTVAECGNAMADPWPIYLYPAVFYSISDSSREASRDYGFQFSAGYQLNRDWGFEGLSEATKYRLNDGSGYLDQRGASVQAIYNIGRFVPESPVRPFGIIGGGWLHTDGPKTSWDSPIMRAGFGAEWQIPKTHFNVRSDAVVRHEFGGEAGTGQSSTDFNDYLVSMGINYRFGSATIPLAKTEPAPGLNNPFGAAPSKPVVVTSDVESISAGAAASRSPGAPAGMAAALPSSAPVAQEKVSSGVPASNDQDGDGVDDQHDKCPDTPPGAVVDADGCIVYMKRR